MYPTVQVLLGDVAASLCFTLLAVLWLLYVAEDPFAYDDVKKLERSTVERFFITNALSFFVGWTYIVWMRDVVTLLGESIGKDGANWGFFGQVALVAFFGPVLTSLLIWGKMCFLRSYKAPRARDGSAATRPLTGNSTPPDGPESTAAALPWPVECACEVSSGGGGCDSACRGGGACGSGRAVPLDGAGAGVSPTSAATGPNTHGPNGNAAPRLLLFAPVVGIPIGPGREGTPGDT